MNPHTSMSKPRAMGSAFLGWLLAGAAMLGMAVAACAPQPPATPPPLPPGFAEAPVPDVELLAYAYVNQGQPFAVSGELLDLEAGTQPQDVRVGSLALWDGPTLKTAGLQASLGSPQEAEALAKLVSRQEDLWIQAQGPVLRIVGGLDEGSKALQEAIQQSRFTDFKERFPKVWETLLFLPQNPEGKSLAAGFVKIEGQLSEQVAGLSGLENLNDFIGALNTARIEHIGFGVYSREPFTSVDAHLSIRDLEEKGAVVALVARSGYPSAAFSPAFQGVIRSQGLVEQQVDGASLFVRKYGDLQFALANKGNVVYAAASAKEGDAVKMVQEMLRGQ